MSPYRKESHKELYRVHRNGQDTEQSRKLWSARPYEELYDIHSDAQELYNRADDRRLREIKQTLITRLRAWIIETRDSAFMTEPEMHRRALAAGSTPYDILQDASYDIETVLRSAEKASHPDGKPIAVSDDPIVNFWAIQQRIIRKDRSQEALTFLRRQLQSNNLMVRGTAAEALARMGHAEEAMPIFRELLCVQEPNLLLYSARSLAISLDDVRPLEEEIRHARQRMLAPPGSPRPWKDFTYSAFTTWALEWALIKSELNTPDDFNLR